MELVCPAGNMPSLKAALSAGADAVYIGLNNDTNARHFPGLNFSSGNLAKAVRIAHDANKKLFIAINTYADSDRWSEWQRAADEAADSGIDALIVADISMMDYIANRYPETALHLSVQASATNASALSFYQRNFNIRRAVIPRVLSLKQLNTLARTADVPLEVFGFGSLCIMAEGRCHLSSYLTSESPNLSGACSPAEYVRWENNGDTLETRLNDVLIDRFSPDENAGYPTLCKGRFHANNRLFNVMEEPTSLNTLALIPQLHALDIKAIKIEGRQRSPAYVKTVVSTWRKALDSYQQNPDNFSIKPEWNSALQAQSEGKQTTFGAYNRPWH